MKILFNILLILIVQNSFGQDYLEYYKQINEAKLLAADSKYQESTLLFKKTFDQYDFEFARDCVNAVEVSALIQQDTLTSYFIKCALKRGVPISYFSSRTLFADFRSTEYWNDLIKASADFKKGYDANINAEIRAEINQMFTEDQEIRARFYHWSNFLFRSFIANKWEKLNNEQVNRMMEITVEHGFPGEKLIGIDLPEYHDKIDADQFSAGMS